MSEGETWEQAQPRHTDPHPVRLEAYEVLRKSSVLVEQYGKWPAWFEKVTKTVIDIASRVTYEDGRTKYELNYFPAEIADYANVDVKDARKAMRILTDISLLHCHAEATRTTRGWWTLTLYRNVAWSEAVALINEAKRARGRGAGQQTERARAERGASLPEKGKFYEGPADQRGRRTGHMTPSNGSHDPIAQNSYGSHDPIAAGHMTPSKSEGYGSHDPHLLLKGSHLGTGDRADVVDQPQVVGGAALDTQDQLPVATPGHLPIPTAREARNRPDPADGMRPADRRTQQPAPAAEAKILTGWGDCDTCGGVNRRLTPGKSYCRRCHLNVYKPQEAAS